MNLLIHDLSAAEWEKIADGYRDWNVISDTGTIRPCIGCFRCWSSGTGVCAFKDGYENMGALIHEADELVVMSRYTYGGFSSFVKNVFDRSIGYVQPEFETAYGEMHHQKRYREDKPVTFRFRGHGLTQREKEKATAYVAAVCRNLRGTVKEVLFDECPPQENAVQPREGAERSGILLIDCSLRGGRSNTGTFLKKLEVELGMPARTLSLSSADAGKITEAIGSARTVVLGVPLYVDGLPAPAIRLMERVKELDAGQGCILYAVVNNGLYESKQNENLLSMIRDFGEENGFIYRGGLAIGAGEAVGVLMRSAGRSLWPARSAESGLTRLAKAAAAGDEAGENYADPLFFPRWLYILIANTNWQKHKAEARRAARRKTV